MAMTRRRVLAGTAAGAFPLAYSGMFDAVAYAAAGADGKGPPVKDQPLQRISERVFMIEAPTDFRRPRTRG